MLEPQIATGHIKHGQNSSSHWGFNAVLELTFQLNQNEDSIQRYGSGMRARIRGGAARGWERVRRLPGAR